MEPAGTQTGHLQGSLQYRLERIKRTYKMMWEASRGETAHRITWSAVKKSI